MSFTGTYKHGITRAITPIPKPLEWNKRWVEYYINQAGIKFLDKDAPELRRIDPVTMEQAQAIQQTWSMME